MIILRVIMIQNTMQCVPEVTTVVKSASVLGKPYLTLHDSAKLLLLGNDYDGFACDDSSCHSGKSVHHISCTGKVSHRYGYGSAS